MINGNLIVGWKTLFVEDSYGLRTKVRSINGTWSTPADLLLFNIYGYAFDVAVTPVGGAYLAYMYYYQPKDSTTVGVSKSHINGYPHIATSLTGNTINVAALWLSYDGVNQQIYATNGNGTVTLPPLNPTVIQNANNQGLFTEYYNIITWDPSPSESAYIYNVYRNGVLLARVPANELQTIDQNTQLNEPTTYSISTCDNQDAESVPVIVNSPLKSRWSFFGF